MWLHNSSLFRERAPPSFTIILGGAETVWLSFRSRRSGAGVRAVTIFYLIICHRTICVAHLIICLKNKLSIPNNLPKLSTTPTVPRGHMGQIFWELHSKILHWTYCLFVVKLTVTPETTAQDRFVTRPSWINTLLMLKSGDNAVSDIR